MLDVRVSEIVAWEEEIDGLGGVGGSVWGAGAAALSWRWLTDYQITRVMNQDCRGLWSWHILTHTSALTGTRQIHTNTHSLNLYVNARAAGKSRCMFLHKRIAVLLIHAETCQHGHTLQHATSSSALPPTGGHRSGHMLLTAGCKDSNAHKNTRVSSLLAVCSACNMRKSSPRASTWTVVKRSHELWPPSDPHCLFSVHFS